MSGIEQVIEGLKIFAKYGGDISAEHDVIYAGPSMLSKSWLSQEDESKLNELDWYPGAGENSPDYPYGLFCNTRGVWYKFV